MILQSISFYLPHVNKITTYPRVQSEKNPKDVPLFFKNVANIYRLINTFHKLEI